MTTTDQTDAPLVPGWQPIDDPDNPPPRDGRCVLLHCLLREPNLGQVGQGKALNAAWIVHQAYWAHGIWQTGTFYTVQDCDAWMPLPTPPKGGE